MAPFLAYPRHFLHEALGSQQLLRPFPPPLSDLCLPCLIGLLFQLHDLTALQFGEEVADLLLQQQAQLFRNGLTYNFPYPRVRAALAILADDALDVRQRANRLPVALGGQLPLD